ncbi:MAG: hypothetical protein QUV05_03915 [Phycisphaerae bacterium]|nr:hypothetical protein [Phycisphaerae bacterium]
MMLAETTLRLPDYVILVGYFVIMLSIGAYFWRHMKNMRDYFSARNQIPWWLSGVSFYMTSFTTFLFISYSELAYKYGVLPLIIGWTVVPSVMIGAMVLAARWRRARIDSPVEYLEERFSLSLRQTFGWANVPIRMIDNGLRLYATGLFVSGTVGLNLETGIIATAVITLAYTFAGGLWAVTVTDFVQFVVMMAGVIILLPVSLAEVGGIGGFFHGAPKGFFNFTVKPEHNWAWLIAWFIVVMCNYNTSFGLVQRYYSVRNEKEARRTGLLVAFLVLLGTPLFILPAMAAAQHMPGADAKDIYATICVKLLPSGLLGLIIAAMFSATMSSLSGDYNSVASVLTNDVYRRLVNPTASESRLVCVGRVTTFVIGIIPLGIALYVARVIGDDVLFRKMMKVFSVASPPLALPMLAGLVWRKCSNAGATGGFLLGLSTGLILFFAGCQEMVLTFSTTAVTMVGMIVISLLAPARGEELTRSRAFAEKLATPLSPQEIPLPGSGPSSSRVVGGCLAVTAVLLAGLTPMMKWGTGSKSNLVVATGLLVIGLAMIAFTPKNNTQLEQEQ